MPNVHVPGARSAVVTFDLDALFFAAAGPFILVLGVTLLVRGPRTEWSRVASLHLWLVGLFASWAAGDLIWGGPDRKLLADVALHARLLRVADIVTALLILYAALCYPQRPAWLARGGTLRRALLPVTVVLVPSLYIAAWLAGLPVSTSRQPAGDTALLGAAFAHIVPAVAWRQPQFGRRAGGLQCQQQPQPNGVGQHAQDLRHLLWVPSGHDGASRGDGEKGLAFR